MGDAKVKDKPRITKEDGKGPGVGWMGVHVKHCGVHQPRFPTIPYGCGEDTMVGLLGMPLTVQL